jgi:OmpA-OmpF porin, OOP family
MNMKLSGNRALAVVNWLVAKGVARDRLLAVGFGETKPLVANDTAANKEQNRRTEFHIAAVEGKNFLGRDPTAGGTIVKEIQKLAACLSAAASGDSARQR